MKVRNCIILLFSFILIWTVGFLIFIPYDLKTVECETDMLNKYFDTEHFLGDEFVLQTHREEFRNLKYECLSPEETFSILKEPPSDTGVYVVTQSDFFSDIHSLLFFKLDDEFYALCTFVSDEKAFGRVTGAEHAIFRMEEFPSAVAEKFVVSDSALSRPVDAAMGEAIIQNSVVTVISAVAFVLIAFPLSNIHYKRKKQKQPLIINDETGSSEIKNYLKRHFGKEFFDEEKIASLPCVTVDMSDSKASQFIKSLATEYENKEFFIGPFFEKQNFTGEMSELTSFIREYLDEKNYSALKFPENDEVIDLIIQGNIAEETKISLFLANPGVLIYPVPDKLFIFMKDDNVFRQIEQFR